MRKSLKKILVDNNHGQANWGQTGFPLRGVDTTLSGFAVELAELGFSCSPHEAPLTNDSLEGANGLIIPSPTGYFNPVESQWEWFEKSFFTGNEVDTVVSFLRAGGSLLAFAYRFGDPFTKTNLSSLFAPLGCILNDEAVIALNLLEKAHPLYTTFTTTKKLIRSSWASKGVQAIQWRPVTTFSILSNNGVDPLVFSPDNCIRLKWPGRQKIYESAPICVAGRYGKGRFVLVGGPHVFESTD
jgi:hypothetical protein